MSKINVIFVISQTTAQNLKKNFQRDSNGDYIRNDLTSAERRIFKENFGGKWKSISVSGTTYIPLSFYIDATTVSDVDSSLKWIKHIQDKFPNKLIIVGAWDVTGAQYGTTIIPPTYDENGDIETPEQITGTPIYPIHARADELFDGGTFTEVNNLMGWGIRRWV